jgi:hypothetical protein
MQAKVKKYLYTRNIISFDMEKEKDMILEQEMAETMPAEEATAEPEVSVTETTVSATPTSRSRSWMQSKYPDEEWADDVAYEERLANHLEEADGLIAKYKESDEVISDLMERNPEFAMVIMAMRKGMPFEMALRRYLGDIFKDTVEEGDPDWEELKKASDEFLAEKKKSDDEIATRTANLEKSDIAFTEFVERNFPTEEEQVAFAEYVRSTLSNIGMGDFTDNIFEMFLKAYKHDTDVEDAKEAGAIEARNEKITAKRIKEKTDTDGMPMGGGSSPIIEEDMEEDNSFLGGVLRDYEKRRR